MTPDSELVEIQPAVLRSSHYESIPKSPITTVARWLSDSRPEDVMFYGPSSNLKIDGRQLESPLVYHVEGKLSRHFDASLIEAGHSVADTLPRQVEELPYWPSYWGCNPAQRRRYRNWLISGRSDPTIELGYVFIYFYGLERRVLIDEKDHADVLRELLRLLPIYGHSNSFRRYASGLAWMILLCAPEGSISQGLEDQVASTASCRDDQDWAARLSIIDKRGEPLQESLAFAVALRDPRALRSVVTTRHADKFRELFNLRFQQQFPQGYVLRSSKQSTSFEYRPASDTILGMWMGHRLRHLRIPNVLGLQSQFHALTQIWNSCVEDLRSFDRAHKKGSGEVLTGAMYEALPPELQDGDHPDFPRWTSVIDSCTTNEGWVFVPISELAEISGFSRRERLTKKQGEDLLRTADSMRFCLEPDARETGQLYGWNELVCVFPREEERSSDFKSYHAASILLRLGMTVACADGRVDSSELSAITASLQEEFDLSMQEATRLSHLSHLLKKTGANDLQLAKKLRKLPIDQREAVGENLIKIAAADEIVTAGELQVLRKLYRHLELDPERIQQIVAGRVSDAEGESEESSGACDFVLDHDRIRQIMSETAKVSEFLKGVMLDDEENGTGETASLSITAPTENAIPQRDHNIASRATAVELQHGTGSGAGSDASTLNIGRLDRRYHEFVKILITRPSWSRMDLEAIARSAGLMLSGAVEAINEWSLEEYGDWLVSDMDEPISVHLQLIQSEPSR